MARTVEEQAAALAQTVEEQANAAALARTVVAALACSTVHANAAALALARLVEQQADRELHLNCDTTRGQCTIFSI